MTDLEILKNNKLIADFNGYLDKSDPYFYAMNHAYHNGSLKYNSDWNWLFPVCQQIEKTYDEFHGYFGVYIHSNGCTIQGSKLNTSVENFHPAYFLESYGNTKIEAVYLAVIQFIKFWNDKERKDSQREENQTTQNIN